MNPKDNKRKDGRGPGAASPEKFAQAMAYFFPEFDNRPEAVAVGVSGGPDSLALCFLLRQWAAETDGPEIHALTVDHGLRPESANEAAYVREILSGWPRKSAPWTI